MDAESPSHIVDAIPNKKLPNETQSGQNRHDSVLSAVLIALIATALCFGWLFLKTQYLHGGNWTSVFYTGALRAAPSELAKENLYRFPGVVGYDGQLYHLIAHDPLFEKGFDRFLDTPRLRYRRILVPGLAALLSFGNSNLLHAAYISIVLASIYLGTFWLARWCGSSGFSPAWGFLFLAIPSTLITMLFLIVDGTLGALTVGFIWYTKRQSNVRLFIVLACAALTRELGIFLIAGYCLWLLFQRKLLPAIVFGTSVVPAALWYWFVQIHTKPSGPEWFSVIPLLGVYRGIVGHWSYQQPFLVVLDFIAIGGMLLAFGFAAYYIVHRQIWNPSTFMAACFLLFAIFLSNPDVWPEVNAFGRYYTPILLFVATTGMVRGNWWTLAPIALVDLRIGAVFVHHAASIFHAIVSKRP